MRRKERELNSCGSKPRKGVVIVMKDGDLSGEAAAGLAACAAKMRIKQLLPYLGLPVVLAALPITHAGRIDATVLLLSEMIILFGYAAAIVDIKSKRVPNSLILAMLVAWAIIMAPKTLMDTDTAVRLLRDSAIGCAMGGGMFLFVYIVSRKGLGGGDVKFMACAGLYLGFGGTVSVMLYGSVLATLTGLTLILLKKIGRKDMIPLVPFLYIGILIAVFLQ